jgi:Xaa-Pro dipeptidase
MSINLGKALAKISPPSGYFRSNRTRLLSALTLKVGAYAKNACVFLKSGEDPDIHAEDSPEKLFCQENNLWWVSGCEAPNCYAVIELASGNCTLFVTKMEESSKTWMTVLSDTDYTQRLEIDTCLYLDSMESWFKEKNFDQINVLEGTNPYSGRHPIRPEFSWMSGYLVNKQVLYSTINEVRVHKTSDDLDLLRQVGKLGCEGHIFVMQNMKPGMSESHVQSLFRLYGGYNMKSGVPYGEIAAAGGNGARLHYQTNMDDVNDGDMILFDGGFRVNMFCSDITTTWPVNGKFTEKQAKWYNMVLAASKAVFGLAKPGIPHHFL